jgi:hypothetical protein
MKNSFKTVRLYAKVYLQRNFPLSVAYQAAWSVVKFNQTFNSLPNQELIPLDYFIIEYFAEKHQAVIQRIGQKINKSFDNCNYPRHLHYFDLLQNAERMALKANLKHFQYISKAEALARVAEMRETKKLVTSISQVA